jgi:thioredoxin reductase (NADPH)
MTVDRVDFAAVGAGPAGLAAVAEAKRQGVRSILLLDETGRAGGTIGIAHQVCNIPFLQDHVPGEEVSRHIEQFRARIDVEVTQACVVKVESSSRAAVLYADDGRCWHAGAVVVATGTRARHPNVPGLPTQFSPPWADSAPSAMAGGQPHSAAVIGGGDVAFDQARWLNARGVRVWLLCRSACPRAPRWLCEAAAREGVTLMLNCCVVAGQAQGNAASLHVVQLGVPHLLQVDRIVAAAGRIPRQLQGLDRSCQDTCRVAGDATGRSARHVVAALGDGCVAAASLLAARRKEALE